MKVKLNTQVNDYPAGAEIDVSPERGRIMIRDGTARAVTANQPTTDNVPYSKLPGFGPGSPEPLSNVCNKAMKPGHVTRK